jgi:molybdate transport system substrate-binding protein
MKRIVCGGLMAAFWTAPAVADEVRIAVAANFVAPMQKLAQRFTQETGHKAILSLGSTGHFYAQIRNAAPFDVLLAADDDTPLKLEQEGLAVAGSRFTYAVGRLVLWSRQPGLVDDKGDILRSAAVQKLALANPKLAPYGAAAVQTLTSMGLWSSVQARVVLGDNIAQTYQFVATGNAPMGFVALSQVMVEGRLSSGSAWVVPAQLHAPIRQDAVLLKKGQGNVAAVALMSFLRTDNTQNFIRSWGYE